MQILQWRRIKWVGNQDISVIMGYDNFWFFQCEKDVMSKLKEKPVAARSRQAARDSEHPSAGLEEIVPTPAATVMLVRQVKLIEVLLLRRNNKLVFHGGHWVFPGGRIDVEDYAHSPEGLEYEAAIAAAVRETKEEADLDIKPDKLIHIAHWTTPPELPRRFCTWFFVCEVDADSDVAVDNAEIHDYQWINPKQALIEAKAGNIVLPQPTAATLRSFEEHNSVDQLLSSARSQSIHVFPADSPYYNPEVMGLSNG